MQERKSVKLNAAFSVIKQVVAILVPLLLYPYISRVFGPENNGKLNFTNSIVNYFVLFSAFGITSYAAREGAKVRDNKEEFEKFCSELFTINLLFLLVSYIIMALLIFVSPKLQNYAQLIQIQGLILIVNFLMVEWLYTLEEDFLTITIRAVVVQVLYLAGTYLFVREESDYVTYLWILIISAAIGGIACLFRARRYVRLRLTLSLNFRQHVFPMAIFFINSLSFTIYVNLDSTILGVLRGDYETGVYGIPMKVYSILKNILNSYIIVSIPRLTGFAADNDRKSYDALSGEFYRTLMMIFLPMGVGLCCLARPIVELLGGTEYLSGVMSLRILGLSIIPATLGAFLINAILFSIDKEKCGIVITLVGAVVNIVLDVILILLVGMEGAAIATFVIEIFTCIVAFLYARDFRPVLGSLRYYLEIGTGTIGVALTCLLINHIVGENYKGMAIAILCSLIVYGAILSLMGNVEVKSILDKAKGRLKH